MLALGDINSGFWKFLLVLHILSAIVGLGAVMLNGLYAAEGKKRPGPGGQAISEANFAVTGIAEYVIYTIPVFGILLVVFSGDAIKFSDKFVMFGLLFYIIALGIAHGVLIPGGKKINALLAEMEQGPPLAGGPPPQLAQIQELGKRQAMAGMTNNLLVVVILALMVWHPA